MKWQYKRIGGHVLTEEKLNELGEEEWELVSHITPAGTAAGYDQYIFKRPKQEITELPSDPNKPVKLASPGWGEATHHGRTD